MNSRKSLFLVTFFIACLVFLVGIFLGMKIDELRVSNSEQQLVESNLDMESFRTESSFFSEFGIKSCVASEEQVNELQGKIAELGRQLMDYNTKNMQDSQNFKDLKRKYFLQEINSLVLISKLRSECKNYNGTDIIFYYRLDDSESVKQGYALDKLVETSKDVHVFSFDYDFNESAVEAVKKHFGITNVPSVVFDFKILNSKFVSLGELFDYVNKK